MIVEHYSDKYCLDVVDLVKNFYAESIGEYDNLLEPDAILATIRSSNPNDAYLLIINGKCQGILFGKTTSSLINNKAIFQEIMWYVNPSHRRYGVRLLRQTEIMLKSSGISLMIMGVLENSKADKLKAFYKRLGFKAMETHYVRSI